MPPHIDSTIYPQLTLNTATALDMRNATMSTSNMRDAVNSITNTITDNIWSATTGSSTIADTNIWSATTGSSPSINVSFDDLSSSLLSRQFHMLDKFEQLMLDKIKKIFIYDAFDNNNTFTVKKPDGTEITYHMDEDGNITKDSSNVDFDEFVGLLLEQE